jgi:sulfopyruvate decarboxylase TPP-binding subunit
MAKTATGVTARIVDELAGCGIRLVASLPDNWIAELITAIEQDDRFIHVRANREESAIGLCSGAFLGGVRSVALMGARGS